MDPLPERLEWADAATPKQKTRSVDLVTLQMEDVLTGEFTAYRHFINIKDPKYEKSVFAWIRHPKYGDVLMEVGTVGHLYPEVVLITDEIPDVSVLASQLGAYLKTMLRWDAGDIHHTQEHYSVSYVEYNPNKGVTNNSKTSKRVAKWKNDKQPYHKR